MSEHIQSPVEAPKRLLPRIGSIWFFIIATIVAVALGVVRSAEQGQAMAAALVLLVVFVVSLGTVSALSFSIAFLLGATEKAISDAAVPESPFAKDTLPEKVDLVNAPDEV